MLCCLESGNPRKFWHGIYLVYTRYILSAFLIVVYTKYMTGIWFLEKVTFVSYWMHVCMQWVLPKYAIHRALDGDLFSKSYIELNMSMVYDSHILSLHLVYTTFFLVLVLSEEMLRNKIQNFYHNSAPACKHNCQGGRHVMNPRKALFYWVGTYDR